MPYSKSNNPLSKCMCVCLCLCLWTGHKGLAEGRVGVPAASLSDSRLQERHALLGEDAAEPPAGTHSRLSAGPQDEAQRHGCAVPDPAQLLRGGDRGQSKAFSSFYSDFLLLLLFFQFIHAFIFFRSFFILHFPLMWLVSKWKFSDIFPYLTAIRYTNSLARYGIIISRQCNIKHQVISYRGNCYSRWSLDLPLHTDIRLTVYLDTLKLMNCMTLFCSLYTILSLLSLTFVVN